MELNDQTGLEFEFLVPMGWGSLDLAIIIEVASSLEELETERVVAVSIQTGEEVFELDWNSIKAIDSLWSDLCDAGEQALGIARDDARFEAA